MKTKNVTTLQLRKSISRSPLRLVFLLIPLALACFGLSPKARAVCQQGCDYYSTFLGEDVLLNSVGYENTAIGFNALYSNIFGEHNTATGHFALARNTSGNYNTANGNVALYFNTTGFDNTANGADALASNRTGFYNTATGSLALNSNGTGNSNTANGVNALFSNTTGSFNTATGIDALRNNEGNFNTASGGYALVSNTTGIANTANGLDALYSNTTGNYNTAVGVNALLRSTGSSNVGLGSNAGKNLTTGSGNVCIGAAIFGVAGESNTTRIRNIYSSVASGRAVYVNSDNKIGTLASTRRVKKDIKAMDKVSEAVLALKPVSFRYKKEIDASGTLQFGLVAEEVADINADLVTRDSEGKPETVRYEAVNAMLLNEFLREHREVVELKSTVAEQRKGMEAMAAQLKEQTAQIQKVSAQLEASKPAPQVVNNP